MLFAGFLPGAKAGPKMIHHQNCCETWAFGQGHCAEGALQVGSVVDTVDGEDTNRSRIALQGDSFPERGHDDRSFAVRSAMPDCVRLHSLAHELDDILSANTRA